MLGLDIGGTKLAAGVISQDGRMLASERLVTPPVSSGDALFQVLEDLCRRVLKEAGTDVIGIGVGSGGPMRYPEGIVSPLNIVSPSKVPLWRDFPLRDRLAAAFDRAVVVDNDAKALALGERWQGAGRGSDNMLGMVVSTGVGGGIILGGQLLHGFAGNSGHVGHIIVWPNGPLCGCGARGCVEGHRLLHHGGE